MFSIDSYDLQTFFGVIPTAYNSYSEDETYQYEVNTRDITLLFTIVPAKNIAHLTMKYQEFIVYELQRIEVDDILFKSKANTVDIRINDKDSIRLVKHDMSSGNPHITVEHYY